MSDFGNHRPDKRLDKLARRLREERAQATDLELDRAKLRAMSRASRGSGERKRGFRPRVVSTLVATGLLALGVVGMGASSGGLPSVSFSASSSSNSSNSQYCPPSSPGAGKPKHGANKCGQP
jgi:hypothetical protein